VPAEYPEGCGSEFSNYLHFTVAYFEYQGLRDLLGSADARGLLEYKLRRPFYRFVYRTVLRDFDRMGAVVAQCGLTL
jgi:hypothetical protein